MLPRKAVTSWTPDILCASVLLRRGRETFIVSAGKRMAAKFARARIGGLSGDQREAGGVDQLRAAAVNPEHSYACYHSYT